MLLSHGWCGVFVIDLPRSNMSPEYICQQIAENIGVQII